MPFRVMIPARYGSTRLPGKPLALIHGKPLIQHVYARACASAAADVVVVTDDVRIEKAATGFGAKVCMTSNQHQSGSDRIAEALELLEWPDDICVVNLQGDEPCMPAMLINQVATDLETHPDAAMATIATQIRDWELIHDHNVVKVVMMPKDMLCTFHAHLFLGIERSFWQMSAINNLLSPKQCVLIDTLVCMLTRQGFCANTLPGQL